MGVEKTITPNKYPTQGKLLGKDIRVCFHYETESAIKAKCIRDDVEEPFVTIFQCENGWIVLGSECQYQPVNWDEIVAE